jgi:hypothetical protein
MIHFLSLLISFALIHGSVIAVPQRASTFAGSPSTAIFPPPGVSVTATDTFFLDGSEIGFAGPTLSEHIMVDFPCKAFYANHGC